MESLRALFGRFDLTEEQFLAALDSDELGDMVGSIAEWLLGLLLNRT